MVGLKSAMLRPLFGHTDDRSGPGLGGASGVAPSHTSYSYVPNHWHVPWWLG
jgi:hypothetical protein